MRARLRYPLTAVLLGGSVFAIGIYGLFFVPTDGRALRSAVHAALGGCMAFAGLWRFLVPPLLIDENGLRVHSHVPGSPARHVIPADIVWRRRTGYVGARIAAVDDHGRPLRIPVWQLRRSDAQVLFDWLDANVPPPSEPRGEVRR